MDYFVIEIEPEAEEDQNKIQELIKKAEENIFTVTMVKEMISEGKIPSEFFEEYSIELSNGHVALFNVEDTGDGPFRHLCVTHKLPGEVPPIPEFKRIMKLFEFKNSLDICIQRGFVWDNEIEGRKVAINVVEPLDGDFDKLYGPL